MADALPDPGQDGCGRASVGAHLTTLPDLGNPQPAARLLVSICILPLSDWSLNCWRSGEKEDG